MPTIRRTRPAPGSRASALATAVAAAVAAGGAAANPSGASVQAGAVQLSNPSPGLLQVVNTPGAIVNWQSFSIGSGETARFVQLNAASAILNRVTGSNPSSILGRLESNGRVFLVNPNGIVFGGASVVDTAALIASTRDISNADFVAGRYVFDGTGTGAITVQAGARITTAAQSPSGGQVWLFAKSVTTEGGSRIEAPRGQVVLAAGDTLVVGTDQLGGMQFNVSARAGDTVRAMGDVLARRGAVGFFADMVNLSGRVDARSDAGGQGMIAAAASSELKVERGAVLDVSADGANAKAGTIVLDATRRLAIDPGAEVLAESLEGTGGTIRLAGYQVDLPAPSGSETYGETNQSVRAFGSGASTDGRVTVEERGSFSYGFAPQALASAGWTYQSTDPATQWPSGVLPNLPGAAEAGDGAVLVARNDFNVTGSTDDIRFSILRDGGTAGGLSLLPSNRGLYEIKGLSRGGWALAYTDWTGSASTSSQGVRIVDAAGQVKATLTYGFFRQLSVVPLPSGAVWVREFADGSTTVESSSRVFSAAGVELTGADRAAALGSVRAVDPARIARASASGPVFASSDPVFASSRSATGSAVDGYYRDGDALAQGASTDTDTSSTSTALRRGSEILTTLPDSTSSTSRTNDQSPSGWTVTGTETRTVLPPATDSVRVLFASGGGTGTRTDARNETSYRPGQGLNGSGAVVIRRTYSESRSETSTGSGQYTGIWITPAEAEFWQNTWIPSLNLYSADGHFIPPISASTSSGGTTYAYRFDDRYDLLRFTRTASGAPVAPASVGASLGVSSALGTRPGASNADPGFVPPPVVSGGGGASFGGVSGCNAAVCSDEATVARALSVVHATQKAMDVAACASQPGGCSDAEKAAAAVRAVWEEHVRRTGGRTAGQDAQEGRLAVRDFDKLNDFIGGLTRGIDSVPPDEARRRVDAAKAAVDEFVRREIVSQQLGLNPRSDPDDRALLDALVNMTDAQKETFVRAVVREQQIDPDFGAPAPAPAPRPQDPAVPLPGPEPAQPAGNEGNGENTIVQRTEGPCTGSVEECNAQPDGPLAYPDMAPERREPSVAQ